MRKFLIFVAIVFAALLFFYSKRSSFHKTKAISMNGHLLNIEVADTNETRALGLSGRKNMPKNEGVMFIFPTPGFYRFWMKDMKFPLDFIWIDQNKVVDLSENIQPPTTVGIENLPTFTSKAPFDKVLEVNAGVIKALKIDRGNRIIN